MMLGIDGHETFLRIDHDGSQGTVESQDRGISCGVDGSVDEESAEEVERARQPHSSRMPRPPIEWQGLVQ